MIDVALRQTDDTAAANAQTPAEVDLLVMGEEAAVETATVPVVAGTDHEGGTRGPEHVGGVVVLPVVLLDGVEEATATEGVAVAVEVSPTRPRILERHLIIYREELGLTGGHIVVGVHELQERRQPVGRHLDVAVEQQVVLGIDLAQRLVVTLGKAPVLAEHDERHLGELRVHQLQRVVGRRIVGHDDGGLVARVLNHRGQVLPQHRRSIPVEYDYGQFLHFFISISSFNFVDFCHDSAIQASLMALAAPKVLISHLRSEERRFVAVEVAKTHAHQLIVVVRAGVLRRQLHTDVVACETMHGTTARGTLEEHLGLLTDVAGVESLGLLVAEFEQTLGAQLLLLLGHDIVNLQRRRPWTLAVGEDVKLRDVEVVEKRVGLLKALGRLAATAHHHVDTDEGIGHHRLDAANLVGKELAVVVTVHETQHGVGATLQRYVEVGHERTALGAVVDELVAQQVGLQRADAVAADAVDSIKGTHQVEEVLAGGLAEVADVDTRQHNLLAALGSRLAGLLHQRLDAGVATEPAGIGNGAVGAEVVAAVLHLQEVARAVATRARRCKRTDVLRLHCSVRRNIAATHETV